jgi:tetratricopeptide (TPR) repeat protein
MLGALEAAIRLAGYGYPTSLFQKVRLEDRDYLINNEKFGLLFFSPEMCQWTLPVKMEPVKPPDTFRILIFGESAAQGDPEPCYGAGRYLEVLLRERYPGVHFEVINLGMVAINSHVVLPIARESARCQADLWIVYMGNNEMIGPFGAATVFGAKALPWPLVRCSLALKTTRTGQLLSNLGGRLSGHNRPRIWEGMALFLGNQVPPDDPRREVVYKNFQRNLQDILRAGRKAGAATILNTVAVNLKDCSPFASFPSTNLSSPDRESVKRLCAQGREAELRGDWELATSNFAAAVTLDLKTADAQFHYGRCLLRLNRFADAAAHLQSACDYDALPFRADSRINGIIRETGRSFAGPDLVLCDAAASLLDTGGIAGRESFFEHVHLNFDGNYRLALLWAAQAERFLPKHVRDRANGTWASQKLCDARLGLTSWNRSDVLSQVLLRLGEPPLNAQFDIQRQVSDLTNQRTAVAQGSTPAAIAEARALYADAIARAPRDYMLHQNYALFLQMNGEFHEAAREWRQAAELAPFNPVALASEGECLVMDRDFISARQSFSQAVALEPQFALAWRELGNLDALEGKEEEALKNYHLAEALLPNDLQTCVFIGEALAKLKRVDESVQYFQRALQIKGDDWTAHYALGDVFLNQGRVAEAKEQFQQVVRLNPGLAKGHLNLGAALVRLNDLLAAREQFEEVLRLDPDNQLARTYLSTLPK